MEHRFTHPARVVEIRPEEHGEEDPEIDEFLPRGPAATDDGTPVSTLPRAQDDPR
jgi:hypothetical protein